MANNNASADAASNLDTQPVKPAPDTGQTPVGLMKDAGAGVPERKPEGNLEGGTTLPEKFRDAAGIDKLPAPGTANVAARKVEDDASHGGPVRVRQQESMVTPDGQTVNGRLYTKQGQEYFAQTEGENRRIYPVTRSETGVPTLQTPDARATRNNRDAEPVARVEDTPGGRRREVDPAVVKPEEIGGRRREVDPSVVKPDETGGRVGRDGKVVDGTLETGGRRREVDPAVVKPEEIGGRRREVDPAVVKPEEIGGRRREVDPAVVKPEEIGGRRREVDPAVVKPEESPGRHSRRDADSAATPDGTNPLRSERELRVEQNRAVLAGQGDQVQTAQAAALAQLRAQADKAAVATPAADTKGQPSGVNPGNHDSKPGSENKGIPAVPSTPVAEVRLPGPDNKGQNPGLEPRSVMPTIDGKSVQQLVTESKPFQQLPPERQAEIIKGLNEVQRPQQPNQADKPVDSGAKPVDLGVKSADLGGKPVDFGAKPVDPGMRPVEVKLPDGKAQEVKTGELVPGRVLDPSGNPLRGPDGNPMKFSDMVAAGIKPGDILRPGDLKPVELKAVEMKPGEGLKAGEGLKPGEAQKVADAIAGKAIDPALVAKLGEGLKLGEGIKIGDKVALPGAELPGGKLAADSAAILKEKGGVTDAATRTPTSALSDMAKALGLNAEVTRPADSKVVNPQDLKLPDSALKVAADALKPTTVDVGKVEVKADFKGLDVARSDSALNPAVKLTTADAALPGVREVVKTDGAIGAKPEAAGKTDIGRPESFAQKIDGALSAPLAAAQRFEVDKNAPTVKVDQVILPGDKLDTSSVTKIELDPDKKATDTAGSAARFDELLDKAKKQREEEKFDEEDQLNSRNAMMMALLAQKKQKQEQEEKELQLRNDDAKKKDEDKRRRYVVKEKETLESIAKKQLRDVRLAALIYEINKHMLPIRMEKGKQVVDPRPGTAIWLPTEAEIKEFRSRLYAATSTDAGAGAPGAKFGSAEDELASKFGSGWDGAKTGASAVDGMLGSAVAKSQTRRENIEKILGPMSDKPSDSARIRYIVRLTDSIESVAQKHPALKDASLWPLVASVNHLPTGLDQFGRPAAELRRGMVLDIPLPYEIERFRLESNAEDLDDELDDEVDNDQVSADESGENRSSNSDLGVETSDSAPAVSTDWESTVKLKSSHPLIASPVLSAGIQQAPAAVPPVSPTLTPSATPASAPLAAPTPMPSPTTVAAKPTFPFSSQQAAVTTNPTLPLPVPVTTQDQAQPSTSATVSTTSSATPSASVQAPLPAVVQNPIPGPISPPLPPPLPPQAIGQQPSAQQPGGQHTMVSQPVSPQQPGLPSLPASLAAPPVNAQPSSQTDTNPVLSAVPVISQIQAGAGARPSQLRTALDQPPIDAGDRFIWQLDPSVRLVKSTMKWDPSVGVFRSQLELLLNEIWYPVIFYEVFPHMAVRHEYLGGGRKKSVKMDLPPTPAQELADNDLVNNWQRYCHNFVAQMNGPKTGPPA